MGRKIIGSEFVNAYRVVEGQEIVERIEVFKLEADQEPLRSTEEEQEFLRVETERALLRREEANRQKAEDEAEDEAERKTNPGRNLGGRPAKNKVLRTMKLSVKFHMATKIVALHRGITIDEYVDEVLYSIVARDFVDGPGKEVTFAPVTMAVLGLDKAPTIDA